MYCYRKHGHNETDEPSFTQPMLYRKIAAHKQVSALYTRQLVEAGTISEAEGEEIKAEYSAALDENLAKAKTREAAKAEKRKAAAATIENPGAAAFKGSNAVFQPAFKHTPVNTAVDAATLDQVVRALTTVPENFKVHSKIKRFTEARAEAHKHGGPYDWGMGEALAFGTLLLDGTPVRLSGQDCERGTFTHRHAVFNDTETGEKYTPLNAIAPDKQGKLCVYNSLLSEAAVLGFDYGYSLDYPEMLCIWEAQFGDFANGAQVVIDQFITSGESKWQRCSGITLLLPHGYEGQGPEHSSARLERFLQLCAENNIQVVNLTTPAQLFHGLRRQMKRDFKKPLVVMSPKSLLRHPGAVSKLEDFTTGSFQEIIDDPIESEKCDRVILCSGKVYYDLIDYREKNKVANTAIIRVEQLYPLHRDRLAELADAYGRDARLVWCQEEPQNMGAWSFIAPQLEEIFGRKPAYAGRDAASSPAVGLLALHRMQLATFLRNAFTL
jgi:2-oxoglutarate dehydrogenase E1 component